jgi:hypothetical protein
MAGSIRSSFSTTEAVLRPTPRQRLQLGPLQGNFAAVLLDEDAAEAMTFLAFML